jgi:hypothetical protein
LFEQIVNLDLEGMVCKRKDSPYRVTGEAVAALDQSEESTLQPAGGREEFSETPLMSKCWNGALIVRSKMDVLL